MNTTKFKQNRLVCYSIGLLFNVLIATTVKAQKEITVTDYLHMITESKQVKDNNYELSFLSEYNYRLPLLKELQLRSETRDFLLNSQEYSMRIKHTSLKAISKQERLYQNKLEKATLENALFFNEELEKRYFQIVNYVHLQELTALIKDRRKQLIDKSRILKESMYEVNFDVIDLVAIEDQLSTIEQKLKNLKEEQLKQQLDMKQVFNNQRDSIKFNYENLISPEAIIQKSKKGFSSNTPLEISIQNLELNTMINELELKKVKSNQLLDFVELKYQGANDFIFQENISVGIGFNLEFASNRKRKGDYYFDKLSEEIKLAKLEDDISNTQKEEMIAFKKAINNFITAQNQIKNGSVIPIYEIYQNMEGAPPLILVKLKLLMNDQQIAFAEAKHELYTRYINTLSIQEILFQKPLRNYLSASNIFINP